MTFNTGLTALRATQTAMRVVGNNIANVSTEGYRRQEVLFVENAPVTLGKFSIGTGVSIGDIRSVSNNTLEASLVKNASLGGALSSKLDSARAMESLFLPGTGNIQERTEELFLDLESLSAHPTESTLRSAVVHSASELSAEINRVSTTLDDMLSANDLQIKNVIELINTKSDEVAGLNKQITDLENVGKTASGLRNQRDAAIRELSEYIEVEQTIGENGEEYFSLGGGAFSITTGLRKMELRKNALGEIEVWSEGCDKPHQLEGGRLGGLLAQSGGDGGVQALKNRLSEFSAAMVNHLNRAHAIGVGIGGAMTSLTGTTLVEDPAASLGSQDIVSATREGSLFVSVNDDGNTTVSKLDFNPSSNSLDDLATQISGIDHLSARVDSLGRLSISAESGYSFDFTGNLQTNPDTVAITGTTVPEVAGRYSGNVNEQWTFQFRSSGTVGVTEGLQVAVIDGNGLTQRLLEVGSNYEPGSRLVVGDGVELAMSSGTANTGDEFSLQVAAEPDETGILAALGLNTLFVNDEPGKMAINPLIEANPSLLATTTNGEPSDTRNLHRMLDIRESRILGDGTVTIEQYLSDMIAGVGNEATELARDVEAHEANTTFLENELDSIVGVDVNEELGKMLQYQRSYQAAARYISSVDNMLQDLFSLIR